MQKIQLPTIKALASLIRSLKPQIEDDFRADEFSDTPGICLTVGAGPDGWAYQTGNNSYSGGAYHHPYWGVVSIHRDSNSRDLAKDCIDEIEDAASQ